MGAAPALGAKKVIIKVGHMYSNKNPTHYGAVEFGKILDKLSKGTMEVQVFLKGQVGDGKTQLQSVQLGAIQATFQGLTQFPAYDSLNLPYFWKSTKHVRTVANGPLFERWRKEFLKKRGTIMVSVINRGARHVLSRKKPLKTLADFKGLKIRVPQAPPWVLGLPGTRLEAHADVLGGRVQRHAAGHGRRHGEHPGDALHEQILRSGANT